MRVLVERKHLARSCAASSLIVKYQCPEECALKFEISPSTQTEEKRDSSDFRTAPVSSETVNGRRSVSSKREEKSGWLMRAKRMQDGTAKVNHAGNESQFQCMHQLHRQAAKTAKFAK
jgi:hypothetical protein